MQKICMITQSQYPLDPRVRREAVALENNGYEVDIICIGFNKEKKIEKYGKVTAYRILTVPPGFDGILRYILISGLFFTLTFFKLQQLYFKRKYSAIHVHNMPEFHVFTTLIQKIAGVPIVLDIHDLTPELFETKFHNKKYILTIARFFEKISTSYVNKVITVTEGCKEILIERGVPAKKISLILNTADNNFFNFNNNRDFKKIDSNARFLYHGTAAYRFGLHIAIEALAKVNNEIPGSKLFVYGKYDDSYKEYLNELIKVYNLEDNVILNDSVHWEKLIEIMDNSDLEIVPYLNNKYMNLSLSTKIFECAASGLPVLASKLRTLSLTFNDKSIEYFTDDSSEILADRMIYLCKNPLRRKELSNNAYESLKEISWDVMAQRYVQLMENLMKITPVLKPKNENIVVL